MSDFTAGLLGIIVMLALIISVAWWFGFDRILWILGSTIAVFAISAFGDSSPEKLKNKK